MLRYAPGGQTRQGAVWLQVRSKRQLEHRDAIQVDPIVFDFPCWAARAEVPLLSNDFSGWFSFAGPSKRELLGSLSLSFGELQSDSLQWHRLIEQQPYDLLSCLRCPPAGTSSGESGFDRKVGILRSDFNRTGRFQIEPLLRISNPT